MKSDRFKAKSTSTKQKKKIGNKKRSLMGKTATNKQSKNKDKKQTVATKHKTAIETDSSSTQKKKRTINEPKCSKKVSVEKEAVSY